MAAYLEAFWGYIWPTASQNYTPVVGPWAMPKHSGLKEFVDHAISTIGRDQIKPPNKRTFGGSRQPDFLERNLFFRWRGPERVLEKMHQNANNYPSVGFWPLYFVYVVCLHFLSFFKVFFCVLCFCYHLFLLSLFCFCCLVGLGATSPHLTLPFMTTSFCYLFLHSFLSFVFVFMVCCWFLWGGGVLHWLLLLFPGLLFVVSACW